MLIQGIVFDSLCHLKVSFEVRGYDASLKPPAARPTGIAAIVGRPTFFGRFAPSSLQAVKNRHFVQTEFTESMLH